MTLLLAAAFAWAGLLATASAGHAQDPADGFRVQLTAEGLAEPAAPECNVFEGELACRFVAELQDKDHASCDFGGAVTEVRLASEGPAQTGYQCIDEAFHGWPALAFNETFNRAGFTCRLRAVGDGIGGVTQLRCTNRSDSSFVVTPTGEVRTATSSETHSWLALGDSYSSGEGIAGTTPDENLNGVRYHGRDCNRAIGEGTKATAWAIAAYERLSSEFSRPTFVPCTGAITDEAVAQISEAEDLSGSTSWDLVTLGFGGNNLGFAQLIEDCLDIPKSWDNVRTVGCGPDEGELRNRVDGLVAERGSPFKGGTTLPQLFKRVAASVNNGGDVVVSGYPQLIEEVQRWPRWRQIVGLCAGIADDDVGMLRSVTGYFNQQIALATQAADRRYRDQGVRFHFVDIANDPYEFSVDPGSRHGLCSRDPWINGISTGVSDGDLQLERSFHPKQAGHSNTGRVVASLIEDQVRFDDGVDPLEGDLGFQGLGALRFGMTEGEIEEAGVRLTEFGGIGVCAQPVDNPRQVFLGVDPQRRLSVIGTAGTLEAPSDVSTTAGIAAGDSVAELRDAYGEDLVFVGVEEGGAWREVGQGTDFYVSAPAGRLEFWTADGRVIGIYAAAGPFEVPTEEWCS